MYTLEKYHIYTNKEQRICIHCYYNNRRISFMEQKIYKSYRSFKSVLNGLVKINILWKDREKSYPFKNYYGLTANGVIFVENILRK